VFTLPADPAVQIQTADEYLEGQKWGVVGRKRSSADHRVAGSSPAGCKV